MKPQSDLHSIEDIPWTEIRPTDTGSKGSGVVEQILSQDPDNPDLLTRKLHFEKGFKSTETLTHPFWEEVYVLKGKLKDHLNNLICEEGYYCCRQPGMPHGPFEALEETITFEFHYVPKD